MLFRGTQQTMIGSEKSTEHRRRNERYAGHTEKVSGLNKLKNLAKREKLEVWGINSTLRIYQISLFMEFKECCWPRKLNFSDIQEIIFVAF